MKAVHLQALASLLMLAVAQLATAAVDDYKVIKLEQDVRKLEQQVRDLSRQVAELRRDATWSAGPAPAPGDREATAASGSPPWLSAKNWQRLQIGMTELQVIDTLGPPTSMRSDAKDTRTLLYALEIGTGNFLSGSVQLRDRRVVEISTPVLK